MQAGSGVEVVQEVDGATDIVASVAADQAVGAGDDIMVALRRIVGQAAAAAVDPGQGAGADGGAIVPVLVLDQVVAVDGQGGQPPVFDVIGFQTQHAVAVRDGAGQRSRAAAPGDGARIDDAAVVPFIAGDDVVARIRGIAGAVVTALQQGEAIAVVLGQAHHIVLHAANQAVAGRNRPYRWRTSAVAPADRAGAQGGAIAPVIANRDIVAVGQGRDAVRDRIVMRDGLVAGIGDHIVRAHETADEVAGIAAQQAIGGGNGMAGIDGGAGGAVVPGDGAACAVEHRAGDHVIAVAQQSDAARFVQEGIAVVCLIVIILITADAVVGIGADQAVAGAHHAYGRRAAARPRHGAGLGVAAIGPVRAQHDKVAITFQFHDAAGTDQVVRLRADQAGAGRDVATLVGLGLAGAAIDQRGGALAAAPVRTDHDIVIICQQGDGFAADAIAGVGAHHAVGGHGDGLDIGAERHPGGRAAPAIPAGAADDKCIVRRQQGQVAARQEVAGIADQAVAGRYQAGDGGDAVERGQRARGIFPVRAVDHELRTGQHRQVFADLVGAGAGAGGIEAGAVADQAVGRTDHALDAGRA